VRIADLGEPRGDLAYRNVPIDRLEAPVWAAAKRRGQPIGSVLIVVEAMCFLAGVAL
jgi:hypothetical protein